jgi:hypothetical protein
MSSGILERAHEDAIRRACSDAGKQFGYTVEVGWLARLTTDQNLPRVLVSPDGVSPKVEVKFLGFECELAVGTGSSAAEAILEFFGGMPAALNLFDKGAVSRSLEEAFRGAVPAHHMTSYPSRV